MNAYQIIMATILIAGTTFVATGLLVFRPRLIELMAERDHWRARAIEAEDNPTHTQPIVREDWGEATPWPTPNVGVIDLTRVDDPFMDGADG